MKTRRQRG